MSKANSRPEIPPTVSAEIDSAFLELRQGRSRQALATFQRIQEEHPQYPMASYFVALAATQAGEVELAEKNVTQSIAKRERVSDALALQAVVESMKRSNGNLTSLGDPRVRAENYLREAVAADPANAAPRFELATLLRYNNRRDEARKEIRAAQSRLNPVDAHTVMEVTLALMDLEDLTDEALPAPANPARSLSETFSGAYIALRRGDFPQAKEFLDSAERIASPDIFAYLINDPALRRYRTRSEVARFWD